MCIAYLAIGDPGWPLLIAANRDEFHARASAAAAPWADHPDIIAGRDLVAGGTWLGCTRDGRFGLLTNYREPGHPVPPGAPSRGILVRDFLLGEQHAADYVQRIATHAQDWAGFNLIVGSPGEVWYLGNRDLDGVPRHLSPGHYVLSNHLLDTPWPKSRRLRAALERVPANEWAGHADTILTLLRDTTPAREPDLPATGIPRSRERLLSSPFIVSPDYGTRCSTVVAVSAQGAMQFTEQGYAPDGQARERHDWRFGPAPHDPVRPPRTTEATRAHPPVQTRDAH